MAKNNLFRSQFSALLRKNFAVVLARSWLSTFIRALLLPIAFCALLLCIPKITESPPLPFGSSPPTAIRSLGDAMGGKPLVVYKRPGLGSDIDDVLNTITKSLDQGLVKTIENFDEVTSVCPVDINGHMPCFGVVTFNDSPKSGRPDATWNYTIRFDPASTDGNIDVSSQNNNVQTHTLPLMNAIENAMTNNTESYDVSFFTTYSITEDKAKLQARQNFLAMCSFIINFAFYIVFVFGAQHISSIICRDREIGMSHLIDAMGGGAASARVFSNLLFFDVLYLPLWIIVTGLFQALLWTKLNFGLNLVWNVLSGLASISFSAFWASIFKKGSTGPVMVCLILLAIAAGAAMAQSMNFDGVNIGTVLGLSAVFPPASYIYFFNFAIQAEMNDVTVDASRPLPFEEDTTSWFSSGPQWYNQTGPYVFLIFLVIHIFVYAALAWLIEAKVHGNNRIRRTFNSNSEGEASHVAIQTTGLVKHYKPSFWRKVFCCGRGKTVKAVDGLDLTSHKRQILCLLGPNGSGKTTTLEMLAGYQTPTSGSIELNVSPSSIGICPQKNTMWDELTVREHLTIWNILKGSSDDAASIDKLMETCDLTRKKDSLSKSLSGGMKRKLQLACMLVGGSSICLLDEVTSGLDPISRRAIWNAILQERSRRTMILTTHFLDESEVLSDHITILTLGKMKCQGTPAELKGEYGGGYRVHMPKTVDTTKLDYPITEKRDRYIAITPDSASASTLLASLARGSDESQLFITGPTIEDVFLKVAEEPHTLVGEVSDTISTSAGSGAGNPPGSSAKQQHKDITLFSLYFRQVRAFLIKRILVLRSYWWAYAFCLFLPMIVAWAVRGFVMVTKMPERVLVPYVPPKCDNLISVGSASSYESSAIAYGLYNTALGPQSANQSLTNAILSMNHQRISGSYTGDTDGQVFNTRKDLEDWTLSHPDNTTSGALWLGDKPLLMLPNQYYRAPVVLNLANVARSNTTIYAYAGRLAEINKPDTGRSFAYITVIAFTMFLYPCFFALYPTYERKSQVRALQYSNGVRPFSMWLAYLLFDLTFVVIVAVGVTSIISSAAEWFSIGHIFLVFLLYGIVSIEIVYLVTLISRTEFAAFALSLLAMAIMYIVSIIPALVVFSNEDQAAADGLGYGLGLFLPTMNLFRAMAVGLNTYTIRCRGTEEVTNPSSIYAYGAPIMFLIIQIIGYGCLLLWVEGSTAKWLVTMAKGGAKSSKKDEEEKAGHSLSGRPDVDAEVARVEGTETDLLRLLHVTKRFGSGKKTNVAVDDVSIGLREGEILALLGPNGAGKTTAINCIRGDLSPSEGRILLEGTDTQKNIRLAQQRLGVCPQFDALDLLTVRHQLRFYARCKGVLDIEHDVNEVMARVGITAHASKLGSKLSGGNKRKLSLAIALLGNPPVLLLDEPSSAMDAASKRVLWKVLEAVAPGRSILMTTHSMEEADALATRAAIVAKRMLAVGTTQELRKAHSNEYHVHLILKTAPLSSTEEMAGVAAWAQQKFPTLKFEGENLGGQVRLIIPADSVVPAHEAAVEGAVPSKSFVRYMIDTLELEKEGLGLDCYSIGAATMESVFLSVVKESDAEEESEEKKRAWWKMFGKTV